MRTYIGTSGYQYKHWNNGVFYPRGVRDRLAYALERMTAVEINSSFYRIPPPETVAAWASVIPEGRKMVLKAPQSVTHRRRLKLHSEGGVRQGADLLAYFIGGALQIPPDQRGPVLLQLPGQMHIDLARLEPVLALLAGHGLRAALEIRHASWFVGATLSLLERYGAALVASDWPEFQHAAGADLRLPLPAPTWSGGAVCQQLWRRCAAGRPGAAARALRRADGQRLCVLQQRYPRPCAA